MRYKIEILAVMLSLAQASRWKIALISDVHLNPNYQPNISASSYCEY